MGRRGKSGFSTTAAAAATVGMLVKKTGRTTLNLIATVQLSLGMQVWP